MQKVMRVVDVAAFVLLLIGGLNYLMAGLFGWDLFAMMFGSEISVAGRIIYSIVGLSALLLLGTIIARAVLKSKKSRAN